MKPLVYYCRWHSAKLRLRGRDGKMIWGDLVYQIGETERSQAFRYNQNTWELWLLEDGGEKRLQLDEMGVVMTNADDAPQ